MSDHTDAPGVGDPGPWWASGSDPDEGLDGQDPFDAHRQARTGRSGDETAGAPGTDDAADDDPGRGDREPGELGALAVEAVDLLARVAAATARRAGRSRPAATTEPGAATGTHDGPHVDGRVCDACPVCITLRAVQEARPEVVAHLADAAHHVTAALQAFADAQAGRDDGLQHIDLDP